MKIVIISTLGLGLLGILLPGSYGSLSNSLAIAFGVIPMAILFGVSRKVNPTGVGQFLCGLALVGLSITVFSFSRFCTTMGQTN